MPDWTKEELARKIQDLAPWHYCHAFPHGLTTGAYTVEMLPEKVNRLVAAGAFQKANYPEMLDLGANSGIIAMWFVDNKGSHVVAVERGERYYPQLELAIEAKGYAGKIEPINENICQMDFGIEQFDLILFLGTLHHVGPRQYHRPIFERCHQALRPKGDMVVQTKTEMPVMHLLRAAGFSECKKLYRNDEAGRSAWMGSKAA